MTEIKNILLKLYEKYKHLWCLSYFIIYLLWFGYLERNVTTRFHIIHMALDDYIPFCEYFVIPYILWFGYVAWGIIFTAKNNREDFYKLCGFLYTGMTLFLIFSTIYPNGHYLRPYYFTHHNFCTTLCGWLYSKDTATNLFPSIHVYNSLGVHFAVLNSNDLKHKKTVKIFSWILCVSIILATMFIKQHSVFDVILAILIGSVMYNIIYIRNIKFSSRNTRKVSDKVSGKISHNTKRRYI